MRQIHHDSREYLTVPVTADVPLGTQAVAIALTATRTIATEDWHDAEWADEDTAARILIGPGSGAVAFTKGTYHVHVRVTDNPEIPVIPAGKVNIY